MARQPRPSNQVEVNHYLLISLKFLSSMDKTACSEISMGNLKAFTSASLQSLLIWRVTEFRITMDASFICKGDLHRHGILWDTEALSESSSLLQIYTHYINICIPSVLQFFLKAKMLPKSMPLVLVATPQIPHRHLSGVRVEPPLQQEIPR